MSFPAADARRCTTTTSTKPSTCSRGELTFQLGDDVFTRRAGEVAFAPRGLPHTYANLSGAAARALLLITPAGFERYFDRIAARITGTEPPPEAAKPIPEVITVGPPLGPESIPSAEEPRGVGDEAPVRTNRSRRAEVEEGE
ncbi:MAG TPA: cupin domain-containing protein [Gaiellales bacterium]|nr:cupin domain-containing protein [Gaiellales bacterium]